MDGASFLLPIDGSEESLSAAQFAWELAQKSGAKVAAQHVIDTTAIWRFLKYDRAGFVGSGVYIDAREQIAGSMRTLAESLMLSYSTQSAGRAIVSETYIDEGDPATEIAARATEHDLVIVGCHSRRYAPRRQRLYEKLAAICPCPILVVRKTPHSWSRMQVMVTDDIAKAESYSSIYQIGTLLGLPTEVYLDVEGADVDTDRVTLGGWSPAFGVRSVEHANFKEMITSAPHDALLAVSADCVSGQYAAQYRARIRAFVDQSDCRALLLWRSPASSHLIQRLVS